MKTIAGAVLGFFGGILVTSIVALWPAPLAQVMATVLGAAAVAGGCIWAITELSE